LICGTRGIEEKQKTTKRKQTEPHPGGDRQLPRAISSDGYKIKTFQHMKTAANRGLSLRPV